MRDRRRADESGAGVARWAAVQVVEQAGAAAEKQRDDMYLELVDQAGAEVLLDGTGAAAEGDIPVAGRVGGLLEGGFDAAR